MTGDLTVNEQVASADENPVELIAFIDRSYRVADDGRSVVCDTLATPGELQALRAALAWRRTALAADDPQHADAIVGLRAVITLDDRLLDVAEAGPGTPLGVTRDEAAMLCEIAGAYASERDLAGYQPPEHRFRVELLRALAGVLMDTCCELAAAEDEARAKALLA